MKKTNYIYFDNDVSASNETRIEISNLKGVDFSTNPLTLSNQRSPESVNFEYRNGVNHKRYGYKEVIDITLDAGYTATRINGYWEFTDTYGVLHRVVHAGSRLYEITLTDKHSNNTYTPITLNAINGEFELLDEESFGVVKGNRLYILSGNYLVYGSWNNGSSWECRKVLNDVDTYIPTTTMQIRDINVIDTRKSYEQVNMLNYKRKNLILTEEKVNGKSLALNEIFDVKVGVEIKTAPFNLSIDALKNMFKGDKVSGEYVEVGSIIPVRDNASIPRDRIPIKFTLVNLEGEWSIQIVVGNEPLHKFRVYGEMVNNAFTINNYDLHKPFILIPSLNIRPIFAYPKAFVTANDNIGYAMLTNTLPTSSSTSNSLYTYQLDSNNLSSIDKITIRCLVQGFPLEFEPTLNNGVISVNNDIKSTLNSITNKIGAYDLLSGTINLYVDLMPIESGISNVEVIFSKAHDLADRINDCKFGALFGYGEITELFVSGNENFKSYDFHTTYVGSTSLEADMNLTYFGDLSYTSVGSSVTGIVGYALLDDNQMAIFKEEDNNSPSIYVRSSMINEDSSISEGYVYVGYKVTSCAIGLGAINNSSIKNLANDNLFLNANGVYALHLNSNLKGNIRNALERSRPINSKLLQESYLKDAKCIVYDNRYYLAINGNVYVADARFKSQIGEEMEDTFSYEWYFWNNIPVRCWFVIDNKLSFGTEDGKICVFDKDNGYVDKTYEMLSKRNATLIANDIAISSSDIPTSFNYDLEYSLDNSQVEMTYENGNDTYPIPILLVDKSRCDITFERDKVIFSNSTPLNMYRLNHVSKIYDMYDMEYNYIQGNDTSVIFQAKKGARFINDSSMFYYETKTFDIDVTENGTFYLLDPLSYGFDEIKHYATIIDYADLGIANTIKCYVENNKAVKSKWNSKFFDGGDKTGLKTIKSVYIVTDKGNFAVSINARKSNTNFMKVIPLNSLDFNNIDFDNFVLDNDNVMKTQMQKINLNNVNFFQIILENNEPYDSVVYCLGVNLQITNRIRGVK